MYYINWNNLTTLQHFTFHNHYLLYIMENSKLAFILKAMYFTEEETKAQTVKRWLLSASVPPVILSLHGTPVASSSMKSEVSQWQTPVSSIIQREDSGSLTFQATEEPSWTSLFFLCGRFCEMSRKWTAASGTHLSGISAMLYTDVVYHFRLQLKVKMLLKSNMKD